MKYTKDITFLASFPVFAKKNEDSKVSAIIGVLNIESSDKGAGSLAANKDANSDVISIASKISDIYISIS